MKELFKGIKGMLPGNPFKKWNPVEENRKQWEDRARAIEKMRLDNGKKIEKMDQKELVARFQKNESLTAQELKKVTSNGDRLEELLDLSEQIIGCLDAEENKDFLLKKIRDERINSDIQKASLVKIRDLDPSVWIPLYEQYFLQVQQENSDAYRERIFEDMLNTLEERGSEKYQLAYFSFAKMGLYTAINHLRDPALLRRLATDDALPAKWRIDAVKYMELLSQGERSGYRQSGMDSVEYADIQDIYQKILQERLQEEKERPKDLYSTGNEFEAVAALDADQEKNRALIMSFLVRRLKFLTKHFKGDDERDRRWWLSESRLLEAPIRKLLGRPDTAKNLEILLKECPESDLREIIRLELKFQQ